MVNQSKMKQGNIVKGTSNYLIFHPIRETDFSLSKHNFLDAILLRYNLPTLRPSKHSCGDIFYMTLCSDMQKRVDLSVPETMRYWYDMIAGVCLEEVEIKPKLLGPSGDKLRHKTASAVEKWRVRYLQERFQCLRRKCLVLCSVYERLAFRYMGINPNVALKKQEYGKKRDNTHTRTAILLRMKHDLSFSLLWSEIFIFEEQDAEGLHSPHCVTQTFWQH